jgi:AcrR family transcriptional regulator
MATAPTTKTRILRAAEDVVIRDGVARLTIEGAAQEAGVSKGGVLYHFPTKAALVAAMVERFVQAFDDDLERYGADGGRRGDFVRAYLEASVAPTQSAGTPPEAADATGDLRERRLGAALIASVSSDPELLRPMRDRFDAWQEAVEGDGLDKATASLVRLCVDGLWLCDVFGLAPVTGGLRDELAEKLRALIAEAGTS